MKRQPERFDTLVARYYPAVYSFASRLTDDPREAILLTYEAFNTTRKQLRNRRDEVKLVRTLLDGVIRAGLVAFDSNLTLKLDTRQDGSLYDECYQEKGSRQAYIN